jgi:23S rRNA (cytidine2498-2'-O)-methyltransferase
MSITSSFVFATCNIGSEASLKAEVARQHGPLLTPAFMRPQLITWKSRDPLTAAFDLKSVFARVSGLSLGLCKTTDEIARAASTAFGASSFHLHVFPREVPEEGLADEAWTRMDSLREQIIPSLRAAGLEVHDPRKPKDGEWVMDLVFETDTDHCLAGLHRHWPTRHPLPGGLSRAALPAESPSRAFLKIEQALAWQNLDADDALTGTTALELGCAPGGGTYALLRRGVSVIGVDTGPMNEVVTSYAGPSGARFTHLPVSVGALANHPLPDRIDMLLSDMNLAPPVILKYVEAVQKRVRAKTLIITLKLNDREMESRLPEFIAHFARFAPGPVRATQLQANRREVCLFSRA